MCHNLETNRYLCSVDSRIMATKLYTLEEMKDKHIGLVGTSKRDEYERKVKEDVEALDIATASIDLGGSIGKVALW